MKDVEIKLHYIEFRYESYIKCLKYTSLFRYFDI